MNNFAAFSLDVDKVQSIKNGSCDSEYLSQGCIAVTEPL